MKTHVFLIDDDIEEMRFFVSALNEMGDNFKCTYASSGAHALKMLQYLRPQQLFIKYNLPEMNGIEIMEEVRKIEELQTIPVFLIFLKTDCCLPRKDLLLNNTHYLVNTDGKMGMVSILKSVFNSPVTPMSATAAC